MSKSVVRSVKNVTKGYSPVQVKVRNATSNDAWGPTGTDMSEIAQITFNSNADFYEVMDILDKRLNDKGKNWRHVLKSLKVLDYILHEGSEHVVTWARKNIYLVKTLREFQYIDDDGRDVGANIRTSAKELTSLILDEDRLRAERHDRKLWKSRVTGLDEFSPSSGYGSEVTRPSKPDRERKKTRGNDEEEDLEYRLAIEASKNEAEEDKKRRASKAAPPVDDDDLAKAIRLSKEEEDLRQRQLEEQNAQSLFDDTSTTQQPQATGWNQGYQQQGAVDWYGNLVDTQQPQSTGFLNNAYSQPMNNQQTGFQYGDAGYGYNQYQQPQQSGFDAFANQQNQFMQPQQTAFNMNNPYQQQSNGFNNQPQPIQEQPTVQPGSNNPWAHLTEAQEAQKPQPTGSNNPFATSISRPQPASPQRAPTLDTLYAQKTQTQFNQPFTAPLKFSTPPPQPTQQRETDPHRANLAALLATGDGQDTFGNTGEMRIPAQHTAPGTFVNSAGAGINRMQPVQTGTNPFMHNQFTGVPQQFPTQTGPATGFGGNPNPFGASQQRGNQQQGGSLIDL